jgi:hypothetical protein
MTYGSTVYSYQKYTVGASFNSAINRTNWFISAGSSFLDVYNPNSASSRFVVGITLSAITTGTTYAVRANINNTTSTTDTGGLPIKFVDINNFIYVNRTRAAGGQYSLNIAGYSSGTFFIGATTAWQDLNSSTNIDTTLIATYEPNALSGSKYTADLVGSDGNLITTIS